MIASGDVADYSADVQLAIINNFASVARVSVSLISLKVTAASVRLEITIQSASKAAAEAAQSSLGSALADAATASGLMPAGFTVESTPTITVTSASTGTKIAPPPPSPASSSPSNMWLYYVLIPIAAAAAVLLILVCWCKGRSKGRPKFSPRPGATVLASDGGRTSAARLPEPRPLPGERLEA